MEITKMTGGIFQFNPDEISATIEVLDEDEYELIVGEPKAFSKSKSEESGGGASVGIRYPLTVAEGPSKNKRIFYTCYMTSDNAQAIAKQFLMAAHGYKRNKEEEKAFNDKFRGADWTFNVNDGTCGDAWMSAKGHRVRAALKIKIYNNAPQQQFDPGCFVPIVA